LPGSWNEMLLGSLLGTCWESLVGFHAVNVMGIDDGVNAGVEVGPIVGETMRCTNGYSRWGCERESEWESLLGTNAGSKWAALMGNVAGLLVGTVIGVLCWGCSWNR